MDKYEYNLKIDQMKNLCAEENYEGAADIADSVSWSKVRNVNALVRTGEVYEKVGRYADSKEILLMAYDRSPIGRMIIYRLAEVAVKMQDYAAADEYYKEFIEIAPHDNLRYVLQYEIRKAQNADIKELIKILEELKEQEYTEEWAYELAYLYHKSEMSDKCIEACDELILWFGDGPYVERALELKMLYQPLNKAQEDKYRKFRLAREGITSIGVEEMKRAGEYIHDPVEIPQVSVNTEKFSTVNLQEEIAKGMQQIMEATEKETVSDTMDNIKKIVEDIPYLKLAKTQEIAVEQPHIETDEEIDGSLKTNFQELLGEDSDGQMSLVMNEQSMLERQITGQMTIADVLEEWEKTRRAAETALEDAKQRKLESAKARALQEAGDIMERLTDVLPKLDAGVSPKELLEEEYMQGQNSEKTEDVGQLFSQVNELLGEQIKILNDQNQLMDEKIAEVMGNIPEETSEETIKNDSPEQMIEENMDEAADEEQIADLEITEAEVENPIIEHPQMEVSEIASIPDTQILQEDLVEEEEDIILPEIAPAEELLDDLPEKLPEKDTFTKKASGISKLPEIAMPEDLDLDDEAEEVPVIKQLTEEQKAIFSYFVPVKGMEGQLCQTLTGCVRHIKQDTYANTGNIIIQGGSGCGKTVLATSLIKVLQKETDQLKGRVGKIDAAALNKKDIQELLKKVAGGCLIIERAGGINRETAVTLSLLLEQEKSGLLVILEDTSKGIKKALARDDGFAKKFTEKINVPIFTNDELVSFAKAYANELGYEIDELAVLALYNRISTIQKLDQATTLTEVKDIVDEAIDREAHGGLKKAFSILTATRYTDDDRIILKEKNFE